MDMNSCVQHSSNVVSCEIDAKTVMLDIENGKYHGFNEVGSRIWQMISEPMEIDKICAILAAEFEISQEQCEVEVLRFLQKLDETKLITVS